MADRAPAQRCLRGLQRRYALWLAAGKRCELCGAPVEFADMEADHTEAFVRSGRTNVHEMQCLCRSCNRRKGAR